ncbi:MAG TPA: DUF4173 domain-containing protein [Devosia sp.]|nr:DUF4173 domain-containing protein [Devosia sp.]
MTETSSSGAEAPIWSRRTVALGATAALLVIAGDFLFYRHEPGISLALFFGAAVAALVVLNWDRMRDRKVLIAVGVAVFGLLPLIEAPTFTGVLWGLFGVSILALAIAGELPSRFEDLTATLLRFGLLAPVRLAGDGLRVLSEAGQQKAGRTLLRGLLVWLVPIGFAAVFAFLFVAANPILESWLRAIRLEALLDLVDPARFILWSLLAVMVWPLLAPRLLKLPGVGAMQGPVLPRVEGVIFGTVAIRNSLVLFNAIFAVQSVMDLLFLWGGVRLPDGMSHAEYAHRGAYPLIVTALLAACFVLAAMRKGGAGERSPLIRWLVYLWIGQNVLLVVSSILRLELYVEEFALTELRLAAGLWMALVAAGLVLILARIVLGRSNAWLVTANLTALAVLLYGVSVVDTKALIGWYNVGHAFEITGKGQRLDLYQMGDLGWTAMPALDWFLDHVPEDRVSDAYRDLRLMRSAQAELAIQPIDWQSWSWRGERLRRYVLEHPYAPGS